MHASVFMKKKIISISLVFVLGAPAFGLAQSKTPADTSKIPASQRLENWEDSSNAKLISPVVVVAYGSQKKSSVTGAIAQISDSQMYKRPLTNITEALVGDAPGIQGTLS